MGQEFINAMADMVLAVVNLGVRLTEVSANALTGLFEHLDPSQNEIARNCIDSFTQFAEQIRDALGTIGDAVERFMGESGGQNVVNNLADIVLLIADFAATLAGDIVDTIASFFDSFAGHMVIDLAAAALELLTKALKGLLEILNGPLAPLIEGLIAGFGALVIAQKVVTFFGPLVTLFQTLAAPGGIMAVATGLVTKLAAAFPLLTSPVGLAVAAIAALAVGMVALYNKCEPFRELVDKIIEGFKGFTEAVEKHMLPIIDRVKNIFGNVIDIIVGIFEGDGEKVGEAVRNLVENIVMLIGQLSVAFVEVGWNLIKGLVQGIWECVKAIPKLLAGVGEFIIDFFKGLFGIHSPSTVFAEIGEFMIQGLVQGLSNFKDVIKALKDMATNIVTEAGTKLKEAGTKCVDKIKDGITTAAKTIKDKGKDIVDGIQEGCKNNWDKLKDTGKTLGSKIKDGFCNILGINSPSRVMKEQGKYVVDGVKQGIESNQSAAASIARALGLSIDTNTLQGMSKLTANVSSAISKMSTNSSAAMKKAVTGMVNAFDGIGSKISAKFKTVETSISKVSTNVKTTMTNMVNKLKNAFNFTWKLPNLKLPKLVIENAESKFGFKYPKFSIKWARNGMMVNSPTILGSTPVGCGEQGKEVVIPLENSTFAKTFADTVGNMMLDVMKEQTAAMIKANNNAGQSGGKQDVVLKLNERELGRASIDAINKYQRQVGKTLLRV